MPNFMLKKVAIAQGFRLAFPDELGGLPYLAEELPATAHITSESLGKDVVDVKPEMPPPSLPRQYEEPPVAEPHQQEPPKDPKHLYLREE